MKKFTKPSTFFILVCCLVQVAVGGHGLWLRINQSGHFYEKDFDSFIFHAYYVWAHALSGLLVFLILAVLLIGIIRFFDWLLKKADKEWEANQ